MNAEAARTIDPAHSLSDLVLRNAAGLSLGLTSRGAGISGLDVPLPAGTVSAVLAYADSVLFDTDAHYLGSTVGRYANRIANARFELDGQTIELDPNEGHHGHSLHGGPEGFSHRPWHLRADPDGQGAVFLLDSPNGDQGFPGDVSAEVRYRLQDGWRVLITHRARCNAATPLSLANHAYFNLSGTGSALDHELWVNADRYTPTDKERIPTGAICDVSGTPLDLREPAIIGDRILEAPNTFADANGFDHNYLLNTVPGGMALAARLRSPVTGLTLKVFTTQPALQVYSGQYLGAPFEPGAGICLETQAAPDAPNQPTFPDAILRPDETYEHFTLLEFSQS